MAEFKGFRNDRLKEVMEKHEVTREEIAKGVGAGKRYVDSLLSGKYAPTNCNALFIICDVCNCSADYLLGLSDNIN